MTPIERVSEKSECLTILGLGANATVEDLRRAYKDLIFEKHPDQGHGAPEDIAEITEAYRFLKDHADELGIAATRPVRPAVKARPRIQATETQFSEDVIRECKDCLDDAADHAQHISTMLHRMGRNLTYFVPTAAANGQNDVVVATGDLVDPRHAMPKVVPVKAKHLSAGVYDVPSEICQTMFPGARRVQIRFAS